MLKNILIPLDGSPVSEAALPYATALAGRTGAGLTLVRAVSAPMLPGSHASGVDAILAAEEYLSALGEDLSARGFNVQTGVPYGRSAATWIIDEVGIRHADLVVMATHGRSGPERWVRGSVAEHVVHQAPVPILLVRAADGLRPIERFDQPRPVLIVPLDGSSLAEAALPAAGDLARTLGGHLVLLSVLPEAGQLVAGQGTVVTYVGSDHDRLEAEASEYLASVVSRLAAGGIGVEAVVRLGEPATRIADVALEHRAAAIVMATHGRTGLARAILGSVAGGVLHHSTSPVLLIRPRELRGAEQPLRVNQAALGVAPG